MKRLYFATLLLGVAIGVYGTADYYKTKYRTRAETEIASVRNAFYEEQQAKKQEEKKEAKKKTLNTLHESSTLFPDLEPDDIPEKKSIKEIIKEKGYDVTPGPHVISPDDFGGTYEYECVSLVYYADGVLVDDNQNVVTDIDDTIGEESLQHFGEYEDDAVHVRNDEKMTDYEILLDERKWSDVRQKWVR